MSVPADRPKSRSLGPLRALVPYLRPYRGVLVLALLALLVAAAAMLALPVALRYLIDNGISSKSSDTINQYFVAFLAAAAVFGVFAALRFYLVSWLGERVVADMRSNVYARVIRMDPAFFEVTRIGEVLSRLTADTTLVQSIAGVNLSITLRSTLSLLGSLVMLGVTSLKLTAILVVLIPVVIVPLIVLGRRVRRLSRTSQDRIADTSSIADETLNAVQTVQAFTLEQINTERFDAAVEDSFGAAVRRTRTRSTLTALATMLVFGAITLVLWMGAHAVVRGEMTGGQLGQFLLYAGYVAIAAASLSEMWGEVQRAAGAMERLLELENAQPTIQAPAQPVALPLPGRGELRFEQVTFRYPSRPEAKALDAFDLQVRKGETVAFVGPSGAGKSTTFQLLLRFYDPESGRVLIDGVDLSQADPLEVRSRIGLVPQDTVLFAASARENIRYGRPGASDAEVEAAAKAAAADEFLRKLPEGYDTFLGERGLRLSGGQRQRIAIARAILRDPPLLLLDEATSALDAESERLVQAALDHLMQGRTTIIIAHRLATVLQADRIVVMDHGRIVAQGTHAELVRANELYARLAALQFADGTGEG
ncbi:MAG: ABC transporter transmembrane domain-containing protein [Gammaproteobacteria bacterium]|nr:ABC transporter transmembrane domain-containing protein [Gammaproteobacteria bacterium]MDH5272534.1 ABC transporter transmembrane domain-containing protein [Gammaproteobacteria bacterium]